MPSTRGYYHTTRHRNDERRVPYKEREAKRREIVRSWTHPERRSVKNPVASLGLAVLGHTRSTMLRAQKAYEQLIETRAEAEMVLKRLRNDICDFHSRLGDLWEDGQWALGTSNTNLPLEDIACELRKNPERLQVALFADLDEGLVKFATANGSVDCPLCEGKGKWEKH